MLFNSIDFAFFIPIVFFLYWFVFQNHLKSQNILLVVASYIFYGWWDYRFLSLMIFTTLVDYCIGLLLDKQEKVSKRKALLFMSVALNLGLLGFFKYYNFFIDSFTQAFSFFGQSFEINRLNIILPVGISFYTFQTMSYTIDLYHKKIKVCKDAIAFFSFVSFFPQLVAGPIERASNLLPQFFEKRKFSYLDAIDGSRQILWGLFKKVVIADNCAVYVNDIFFHYTDYSGSTLFIGAILFTIQIYGDFSGYSDIAIGISKLFGFRLMQNFAFPFFSRDMPELWRRWHISLTSWFQDYVYFPLGGSRGSKWFRVRNTFIVFILSGLWHGANLTFIFWGFIFAVYLLPNLLTDGKKVKSKIVAEGKLLPTFMETFEMLRTFLLVVFITVFFRVKNISQGFDYLSRMFSKSLVDLPEVLPQKLILFIGFMILVEWLHRTKKHGLELSTSISSPAKWGIYYGMVILIIFFGGTQQDFIYFQF